MKCELQITLNFNHKYKYFHERIHSSTRLLTNAEKGRKYDFSASIQIIITANSSKCLS
jgi:hypothetical protein